VRVVRFQVSGWKRSVALDRVDLRIVRRADLYQVGRLAAAQPADDTPAASAPRESKSVPLRLPAKQLSDTEIPFVDPEFCSTKKPYLPLFHLSASAPERMPSHL
jgi:hypothetical protein